MTAAEERRERMQAPSARQCAHGIMPRRPGATAVAGKVLLLDRVFETRRALGLLT
jgi:hypothetical protein